MTPTKNNLSAFRNGNPIADAIGNKPLRYVPQINRPNIDTSHKRTNLPQVNNPAALTNLPIGKQSSLRLVSHVPVHGSVSVAIADCHTQSSRPDCGSRQTFAKAVTAGETAPLSQRPTFLGLERIRKLCAVIADNGAVSPVGLALGV